MKEKQNIVVERDSIRVGRSKEKGCKGKWVRLNEI
jgi:hypothetical protein